MNLPAPRPLRAKLADAAGFALLAVAAAGLLLRLTIRDRIPYVAVAYYASPLPLLSGAALLATLALRRRPRARLTAMALAIGALAWWGTAHWSFRSRQPSNDAIRVMFWNVARGVGGWDNVSAAIRDEDADLVSLVESGRPKEMDDYWKARFPDHATLALRGGMAIIVRGEIVEHSLRTLDYRATANRVVVRCRNREWVVWIVDIYSVPTVFRGPPLEWLAARVAEDAGRSTIVAGDFNTPVDSVHLQSLRALYRNAFEAAGDGYAATWPQPVPVLTLDQVWLSGRVEASSCEHRWNAISDHRPVITVLSSQDNP